MKLRAILTAATLSLSLIAGSANAGSVVSIPEAGNSSSNNEGILIAGVIGAIALYFFSQKNKTQTPTALSTSGSSPQANKQYAPHKGQLIKKF